MDNIKLSILTDDLEYGLALGEALSSERNRLLVTVGRSLDDLGGYDLLLHDEQDQKDIFDENSAVTLVESRDRAVVDPEKFRFCLYKYGSVRDMAANLVMIDGLINGREKVILSGEKIRMTAICSGTGGTGKTTVAVALSQALQRYYDRKVLYISLEEMESTLCYWTRREDCLSLSEYLYFLFREGQAQPSPEGFLLRNDFGVGAFLPGLGKNKLRELDPAQLARFLQVVSTQIECDHLVFDMGESLGEQALWLLCQCDKVVAICASEISGGNKEREDRFLSYLNFVLGKRTEKDVVLLQNRAKYMQEEEQGEGGKILIYEDPQSIRAEEGKTEISIDQDLGVGILKLCRKVL